RHTTTIKSTSRPASSYIQNGTTPSRSSSTVDLLKYFIDALEVLAEKGRLEKDATYKSAINFVNDLIQTRESLAASQTAIEPATSISDNI
ncbi:MAG: hypothetical protein ACK54J_00400, partial [Pseudanabaena sp.]